MGGILHTLCVHSTRDSRPPKIQFKLITFKNRNQVREGGPLKRWPMLLDLERERCILGCSEKQLR